MTSAVGVSMDADRATGAAWRRRQRRLRSWWRHEKQTVSAELATATHHSHSKVGTAYDAPRGQTKVTSTRVGPAEYYELSSGPQGKLLRHARVGYEIVLSLDVPVPQMREQLPNIVQFFAAQLPVVAEPVIEVPKISLDRTPQRLGDRLRQPQMAEQLVDVPTVVTYSSLQQLTAEKIVDIPVPGRAGGGGRGGLQGFPGQGSTASSSHVGAADGAGQGFFRTFPQLKEVRGWVRTRGRNWVRTLLHGLWRLMPNAWLSTTTSLRRSRSRRWRWRRAL